MEKVKKYFKQNPYLVGIIGVVLLYVVYTLIKGKKALNSLVGGSMGVLNSIGGKSVSNQGKQTISLFKPLKEGEIQNDGTVLKNIEIIDRTENAELTDALKEFQEIKELYARHPHYQFLIFGKYVNSTSILHNKTYSYIAKRYKVLSASLKDYAKK